MVKKREGYIKAAGFLLALEKANPNKFKTNDIAWKFTTGRLKQKDELILMNYFDATKLSDAYSNFRHGYQYYEGLKCASENELITKGWVTPKDKIIAKKFSLL